ncbi:MAG: Gfo/Idh/MocA family oxidoreductase, partial [Acidobacteria bacterium]|nr:Gfo/Idh/MocA family oxidoreductase [Acidobacteriota bacterium]
MSFTRRHFLHVGAALAAAPPARPAPSDRVGVGFIGCGARAHELIEAVKQHPAAEIAGLVDAYRGRVERARERAGGRAKVYRTYHAVLAQKSIDAVVIAAPDHWHRQMVLDALEAGKDVYVEKPLTYRSSEGLEIIRAARARERMVQVGSQGVSGEAQQKARELIRSGRLGKVTLIRAAYNRNTASGAWIYPIPPDASPQTVDWEMFLGP